VAGRSFLYKGCHSRIYFGLEFTSSRAVTFMQTTNQIKVPLPRERVVELYTCHELLPSWSPGFLSFDVICDGTGGNKPAFRQRYLAMGREIDEEITLMENDLPHGFCTRAENGGTLTRESNVTFQPIDENATRIVVRNTFSGEYVVHLVKQDLQDYTRQYLETFKAFAESRKT
jgi:hypothetical protein